MSNNQEIEEVGCDDVISEKKKSLSMMNFSVKEVAFAINSLGLLLPDGGLWNFRITSSYCFFWNFRIASFGISGISGLLLPDSGFWTVSLFPTVAMEFSVASGFTGEDASVSNLVDYIISAQTAGSSREKESTNKTLVGTMDKRLYLLEMGFSENEVSEAIDNFGSEVPLFELADSIFAKQIANSPVQHNKTLKDAAVELKMKMLQSASEIALL